eukprot:scaffold142468_cov17-Tisochrysis_lutea.AAC.1
MDFSLHSSKRVAPETLDTYSCACFYYLGLSCVFFTSSELLPSLFVVIPFKVDSSRASYVLILCFSSYPVSDT